ncbi:hypothetical protein [Streptomyces antibioticus]|uniref:hypothetical protein n=1 Tax=Streptomyces antibioticus TaxID=1890 RepID=UPI0033F1CAD7
MLAALVRSSPWTRTPSSLGLGGRLHDLHICGKGWHRRSCRIRTQARARALATELVDANRH